MRLPGVTAGERYRFVVDGHPYPDPASRYQPEGVHGWSQVVDTAAFEWRNAPPAQPDLAGLVIYELHVGTFTEEGTFAAAAARLPLHAASWRARFRPWRPPRTTCTRGRGAWILGAVWPVCNKTVVIK